MKKEKSGNNIIKVVCFPDSWKIVKLKTISDITMGQSPKSKFYNNQKEGLPLIQGNNDCKNGFTAPTIWTSYITKTCNSNSLILSVRAPVGIVSKATTRVCIGRGVCSISPKNNTGFLYYYLKYLEKWWAKLSQGSTFKSISSKEIYNLIIPSPPLPEQKKIAEILSTWDKAIEQIQNLIEAKKKLKKGLMQQLLSGRIRFPEFGKGINNNELKFFSGKISEEKVEAEFKKANYKKTKAGWIPKDWECVQFIEICKLVRGPFGGSLKKEIFVQSGYKIYEQQHAIYSDFTSGNYYINKSKYNEMKKFSLKSGDIIMSCSGTAGRFALFPENAEKGVINQALLKISPNTINVDTKYIFYYFHSESFQKELFTDFAGGAIKNIASMPIIKKIPLLIPKLEEQKKIAKILTNCDEQIEVFIKKEETLQNQKKGLMQKLLTGEVRVFRKDLNE